VIFFSLQAAVAKADANFSFTSSIVFMRLFKVLDSNWSISEFIFFSEMAALTHFEHYPCLKMKEN